MIITSTKHSAENYLLDKEKKCNEKIQKILEEDGCFIFPSVTIEANGLGMNASRTGYAILANERNKKERVN